MEAERGDSLIEVVVAVAIVATLGGALIAGAITAAHRFGPDLRHEALMAALQREMAVAADVMKYQGGTIAPATIATTVPLPGASPAPAHLSIAASALANGATRVTIQASLDDEPSESASLQTTLAPPAPLPSSSVMLTGNAPQ